MCQHARWHDSESTYWLHTCFSLIWEITQLCISITGSDIFCSLSAAEGCLVCSRLKIHYSFVWVCFYYSKWNDISTYWHFMAVAETVTFQSPHRCDVQSVTPGLLSVQHQRLLHKYRLSPAQTHKSLYPSRQQSQLWGDERTENKPCMDGSLSGNNWPAETSFLFVCILLLSCLITVRFLFAAGRHNSKLLSNQHQMKLIQHFR